MIREKKRQSTKAAAGSVGVSDSAGCRLQRYPS